MTQVENHTEVTPFLNEIGFNDKTKSLAKARVGLICNIRDGIISGKKAKKWMLRSLPMSEFLKKSGIELFIYAYNHVDLNTGLVRGFVVENNQFVEKEDSVPSINYDWYLGGKVNLYNRNTSATQFSEWAQKRNIHIYPHKVYIDLSKDKFSSYQTIAEFDESLAIRSEIVNGNIEQLQRFIKKSSSVFMKPQFGNRGVGIIVIKRKKDNFIFNHYEDGHKNSLSFDTLEAAFSAAIKVMNKSAYIIQKGIQTKRIGTSTFDIRVVVIGEQKSWKIVTEVRLGAKNSDLSNIAQGGTCIKLDDLLEHFSEDIDINSFKKVLFDKIDQLTSFLDAHFPSKLIEMAYDIIVDSKYNIYIAEINCKPGIPMIFTDFKNVFRLNEQENVLYTQHIEPYCIKIADMLKRRLHESMHSEQQVWFDTLQTPLSLNPAFSNTLMKEIYTAVSQKRSLNKKNLPSSLGDDILPRIIFLSISNGCSKAQVAFGTGLGIVASIENALKKLPALFIPTYAPIWLKVDIVEESRTHTNFDLSLPISFDRSLSGIAFDRELDIAFLPEQLNNYLLISSQRKIHLDNISKYLSHHPYLNNRAQKLKNRDHCTLYQFNLHSFFYSEDNFLPLYRGHRLFNNITKESIINSVNLAIDYLLRSLNENGIFIYSYESKIDRKNQKYNILRHCGTIYSMLEVFEMTEDKQILAATQRGIQYLVNCVKESTVNNLNVLGVVEAGDIKLGGNALAILAITKYIQVTGDNSYLPIIQKLGAWIVNTQSKQGEFTIHKQAYTGEAAKDFNSEYYPGEAILALSRLYQLDQDSTWLNSAIKGALYLINIRDRDIPENKLIHDHWLLYGLNELDKLQPNEAIVAHAMKIANAIMNSQHSEAKVFDWVGGYYDPPRSTPTATRTEGLCAGYHIAKQHGLESQANKILSAIKLGIAFQLQTQFLPESAMYLPNPQTAMGGFHYSLTDFEIRIDYVQHNISSLLGLYKILSST